ncbi:hypothetical protein [Streptomyces sp. NPDC056105]|uniref:hypothetical protein n=1 Tax=Streptomyces sp. NPDC056105 TaxID=3345714 RepID=UPI0035DF81D7
MRPGIAHRYGERLLAEMTGGESRRPRRDAAGVLAHTVALCVHGVTVALLVTGVLLVTLGWAPCPSSAPSCWGSPGCCGPGPGGFPTTLPCCTGPTRPGCSP